MHLIAECTEGNPAENHRVMHVELRSLRGFLRGSLRLKHTRLTHNLSHKTSNFESDIPHSSFIVALLHLCRFEVKLNQHALNPIAQFPYFLIPSTHDYAQPQASTQKDHR